MQNPILLGTCVVCGQGVYAPAPGLAFAQLGNGEVPADPGVPITYTHYGCMNPHEISEGMFRSWIIMMLELMNQRFANHEAALHAGRIEVPQPSLYVPS